MAPRNATLLRFWLVEHSATLGLLLAGCATAVLVLAMVTPLGAATDELGTVTSFGLTESDSGSSPLAVVDLAKGRVTVGLPRGSRCIVGSRIHVWRQRRLWGPAYSASSIPCA